MSSSECGQCPILRQQIAELTSRLNAALARVAWLEQQLAIILGAVLAVLNLIAAELEKATMPRHKLIMQVVGRLQYGYERVTGVRP